MSIPLLSSVELKKLEAHKYPQKASYFAMYSTWYGGIVTDPSLMLVPVDDHLVHRGDGVFEAMKSIGEKVFLFEEHLDRLQNSAAQLSIQWPFSRDEMKTMILETLRASKAPKALIRLFMSRGPGGFTTNPYETVGTQVYCIITDFKPMPEAKYENGVRTGRSLITAKPDWFAAIKSCNYLPNVLMKKEAIDRGLDFTFGFGTGDFLTESSTENIVILDKNNQLVRPKLAQILKGTTMMHAFHLADELLKRGDVAGIIDGIIEKDLVEEDLFTAKEVMMIGTTLDVLPVTEYEGKKIGSGQPGPVAQALRTLLIKAAQP